MILQKYVPQLHRKAIAIFAVLHDCMGRDFLSYVSNNVPNRGGSLTYFIISGVTQSFTGVRILSRGPQCPFSLTFIQALLTRFFLGFMEAAFFPGALFLLSKWYKRSELGQRTAILTCGLLISNAFGALIASGILDGMEGVLGHAACVLNALILHKQPY